MHVREEATDVLSLEPGLPEGLVRFIRGAMTKRPDERLTNWNTIHALLKSDSGRVPSPVSVGELAHTEHIQVSFSSERKEKVYDAVEAFVTKLAMQPGVEVATGKMTPVRPATTLDEEHIDDLDDA